MKITHKLPKLSLSREGEDNPVTILANRTGGFLFLSDPTISKYNGLFVNYDLQLFRVLESIKIADSRYSEVENHLTHIVRRHKGNSEKIVFPEGINGLSYSLAKKARILIDFDCMRMHDMRSFGRMYKVDVDKSGITVSFTKHTDGRDDDTEDVDEFRLCVVVQPKGFVPEKDYESVDAWLESYYSFDHGRKDSPSHRYFYRPFILNAKDVLIGVGRDKGEALAELEKLKKSKPAKNDYRNVDKKKDEAAAAAFICAQDSLECMKTVHEGVTRLYAGYPWFFQLWSRDENVCLGALIRTGQFRTVKDILLKYVDNISKDGRLPNHIPSPHLGSSDGVGWLWKRVGDFIAELKAQDLLDKHISEEELARIRGALADSIKRIEKSYRQDDMIFGRTKENWMDTVWNGEDGREGFCIEVQALHLNMLRLMHELSGEKKYKTSENRMKKKVVERFWNGKELADLAGDFTQRPNIFIAHYAYPDLLSRPEWQAAFDSCLGKVWLDWGGLASIDRGHRLFTPEYTGKDNQSYHRGDSWYWVNNLAALCMFRNNAIHFEEKIKRIVSASAEEIMWHGAVGHHAEISSASQLSSAGCLAQAWSDAMFIELVSEVYGHGA
ncbi:hypothetical protein KY359_04630 [Candidatus Woesearchaeota archaeon]|nr:hypothetical protein [Candidatus Woesearchaeota archaeon]